MKASTPRTSGPHRHAARILQCCAALAFASIVLTGCQRPAETPSGSTTAASANIPDRTPEQLAQSYVSAVQSGDAAQVRALIHPRLLACRNDANAPYFDFLIANAIGNPPHPGYKIATKLLNGAAPSTRLPPDMFPFPVAPAAQFQVDWKDSQYASASLVQSAAPEAGRWYLVYPCPNAAGMQYFAEHMATANQQQQRAKTLALAIDLHLKLQLNDLIHQGRSADAIKKYQAATGADPATAAQVIDALESSQPVAAK